jgi:hypothetical protein
MAGTKAHHLAEEERGMSGGTGRDRGREGGQPVGGAGG